MTQEKHQAAEISASQVVAETTKASLQVYREIRDEIRTIRNNQAAVYLSSIGEQAALELLREVNGNIRGLREDIKEVWSAIDGLRASRAKRQPTGLTGELKLAQEQQAVLDSRVWGIQSDSFDLINAFETFKRQMYEEMDRHARKTTPFWRLVWDKLSEWWGSGK
jgi:hypothetical protein